jgi:hypothetical protein
MSAVLAASTMAAMFASLTGSAGATLAAPAGADADDRTHAAMANRDTATAAWLMTERTRMESAPKK